jgi:hypothetical protein
MKAPLINGGAFFIPTDMFKKKKMKIIEAPDTIEIINGTKFTDADNIVRALSYHIFGYEKLRIRIYYFPKVVKSSKMEYKGVLKKMADGDHSYMIMLNKDLGPYGLQTVLCHEFVHLDQHERGDLMTDGEWFVWKGKGGNMRDIKYEDREFEKEALREQKIVLKKLRKLLYK